MLFRKSQLLNSTHIKTLEFINRGQKISTDKEKGERKGPQKCGFKFIGKKG
jgi:hypothetical protein